MPWFPNWSGLKIDFGAHLHVQFLLHLCSNRHFSGMSPHPQEAWGWPDQKKVHGPLVQVHSLGLLPLMTSVVNFRHFRPDFFWFFLIFFAFFFFFSFFMVSPTWVSGKWPPPLQKLNGSPSWHVHEGEVGHRSLVALGKSKKNLQKKVSPYGLTWPLGPDTSTHPLTSDFFFFFKKKHMDVHHTSPASSQAALQPRRSSLKFFDPRANDDKSLWAVQGHRVHF